MCGTEARSARFIICRLTAARLTDSASAAAFIADNLAQQAALREGYQAKQTPQVASLDEARKNKLNLFPEA